MGTLAVWQGCYGWREFASAQGDTAMGYDVRKNCWNAGCVLGWVSAYWVVAVVEGWKDSGLILGYYLFGILNNALPLINVSPFWQIGVGIQGYGARCSNYERTGTAEY
jgi:rhamnose transport system permease protein